MPVHKNSFIVYSHTVTAATAKAFPYYQFSVGTSGALLLMVSVPYIHHFAGSYSFLFFSFLKSIYSPFHDTLEKVKYEQAGT